MFSPFLSMDCRYDFHIEAAGHENVAIASQETEDGQPVLHTLYFPVNCAALDRPRACFCPVASSADDGQNHRRDPFRGVAFVA